MKNKILTGVLICLFLISCTTTGPKTMYTTDLSTGDVIIPANYVGGLDTLTKKTKGNLIITNSSTKFVSETGIEHFNFPTSSISGVYVGDEVKRHFGKTLARWLLIGPFALFFKDKSEVIAIEFTEKEKNIVVNPVFQIKVGTGPMLKKNIQAKSGFVATDMDWETAKAADTISAYEEFLMQHPDSEFAEEARSRLNILKKEPSEPEVPKKDIPPTEPKPSVPTPTMPMARIEVNQSYAEVQKFNLSKESLERVHNFSLPFYELAKRLLEFAGFEVFERSATGFDIHLVIEAKGKPFTEERSVQNKYGNYQKVTAFTGAELSGTISLKMENLEPYQKEFSGERIFDAVSFDMRGGGIQPMIGPVLNGFLGIFYEDSFLKELCELIVSILDLDPVEVYLDVLNDKDVAFRYEAALLLGKIGDSRAVEPLIVALEKNNSWDKRGAARALGKLGDSRAVEPLILTLKDHHKWVKWEGARALGELGDSRAVKPLILALKEIGKYQRPAVIEALGKLGDPSAVEHIIPWLKKRTTRDEALEALIQLTGQDFGKDHKKWQKWWKEHK